MAEPQSKETKHALNILGWWVGSLLIFLFIGIGPILSFIFALGIAGVVHIIYGD